MKKDPTLDCSDIYKRLHKNSVVFTVSSPELTVIVQIMSAITMISNILQKVMLLEKVIIVHQCLKFSDIH